MKIKKSCLEVFEKVLVGTENVLNFVDARVRDSFLKKVVEQRATYIDERNKLLISLGIKIEGEEDRYKFTPEYLKEVEILDVEEIELPDEIKIKEFIEISEYKPKVGEIDIIDEILTKF